MLKSIHSLVVAKWWYVHSIFSFIFFSWIMFIKRTFSSSSVWLPSGVIHIEKARQMLDFFPPLFSVFRIMSWLTSISPWWSIACLLSPFFFLSPLPPSSLSYSLFLSLLSFSYLLSPFLPFFLTFSISLVLSLFLSYYHYELNDF